MTQANQIHPLELIECDGPHPAARIRLNAITIELLFQHPVRALQTPALHRLERRPHQNDSGTSNCLAVPSTTSGLTHAPPRGGRLYQLLPSTKV